MAEREGDADRCADVDVVVLDVNETLTDLTSVPDVFARIGARGSLGSQWFASILQTGFALSMAGTPRAWPDVAVAVLPRLLHGEHLPMSVDRAVSAVIEGFGELPLHPDVADGIRALRTSGLRVATFSNGSARYSRTLLQRNGLADEVEAILSVEDAPAWKPDPRAYEYALRRLRTEPSRALMVAVHPWDLHGAQQVGMRTALLDRSGSPYPNLGSAPDIASDSLTGLASMIG